MIFVLCDHVITLYTKAPIKFIIWLVTNNDTISTN